MPDPTLVIHGVANRHPQEFKNTVRRLAVDAGRDPAGLVPVFWGDLGAAVDGLRDAIPGLEPRAVRSVDDGADVDGTSLGLALLKGSTDPSIRGGAPESERARVVREAFDERSVMSVRAVRAPGYAERSWFEEIWLETDWLIHVEDEQALRELGAVLAETTGLAGGTDTGDASVRGHQQDALGVVKRAVHLMDRAVGAVLGAAGGNLNRFLRETLAKNVGRFLGDVLVYQRRRGEIQQRVRDTLIDLDVPFSGLGTAERPITVLGHSLGGVIAFDLATSQCAPLFIRNLITFGSQSPFLHILDPRVPVVAPYLPGFPSALPSTIGTWTNLWEPRDPLAFIAAKLFVLASGEPPTDVAVRSLTSSGLWTHSSYWRLPELAKLIRKPCEERE